MKKSTRLAIEQRSLENILEKGFRSIGVRKAHILRKIQKECDDLSKNGYHANHVLKFLKLNPHELWKTPTKELSGVLGKIVQFRKA